MGSNQTGPYFPFSIPHRSIPTNFCLRVLIRLSVILDRPLAEPNHLSSKHLKNNLYDLPYLVTIGPIVSSRNRQVPYASGDIRDFYHIISFAMDQLDSQSHNSPE